MNGLPGVRLLSLSLSLLTLTGCADFGLPCDAPNDEGRPRCNTGYECVSRPVPWGEREICVKAEALPLGTVCAVSEQCEGYKNRTAVCADMHRECPTGKEKECDLKCRQVCRLHDDCGPDQICWTGSGDIPGVCQEGECGERNQSVCPRGLQCTWFKSGNSGGVCFPPCDVVRWRDCKSTPTPTDAKCCGSQEACVHFASNPTNATCLREGRANLNENCDTEEADGLPSCKAGFFCSDLLGCPAGGNCHGTCLEYCRRLGSGGPVCSSQSSLCVTLTGAETQPWGFCQ